MVRDRAIHGIPSRIAAARDGSRTRSDLANRQDSCAKGVHPHWCEARTQRDTTTAESLRQREATRFAATAHMLDWFCICPGDLRPRDAVIVRAAQYVERRLREDADECFQANLTPTSHAVRGLVGLSEGGEP